MPCAMDTPIGAISAVVAVFDIKFVMIQQSMKITNVNMYGEGLSPSIPITLSAISSPAPVASSAEARESVPPNKKIVFRSMESSASFSLITPVTINASAPTHPITHNLMPICSSKIIPRSVNNRMIRERFCFHFGTLLKSFVSSKIPSLLVSTLSGRNLYPNNAKKMIPTIKIGSPTFA